MINSVKHLVGLIIVFIVALGYNLYLGIGIVQNYEAFGFISSIGILLLWLTYNGLSLRLGYLLSKRI